MVCIDAPRFHQKCVFASCANPICNSEYDKVPVQPVKLNLKLGSNVFRYDFVSARNFCQIKPLVGEVDGFFDMGTSVILADPETHGYVNFLSFMDNGFCGNQFPDFIATQNRSL